MPEKNLLTAIAWPEVTIAGESYLVRYTYASDVMLSSWGKTLATATLLEASAAMLGNFVKPGKWRSAGFERPIDLADLFEGPDEAQKVFDAVGPAIKNRYPDLEISARQNPGSEAAPKTMDENPILSSAPGRSPSPAQDSGSQNQNSGG